MTLVIDDVRTDRPQTHGLVIGVGTYTNMGADAAAAFGLDAALTSPPISAAAFARFVADELSCPDAPLGSLDLHISGTDVFSSDRSGVANGIADATTAAVLQAVVDWKERVETQPGNVAVFYFCGHGVEKTRQLGLLLGDFGASANPMEDALDLTATQGAMGALAAPRQQCFFVDACRQPSFEATRRWGQVGRDVLGWQTDLRAAEESALFYATLPVDPAYGLTNQVSPFTSAALRALRGLGARKRGPNDWVVSTSRLGNGVRAAMKWAQFREGAPTQRPQFGGWQGDLPLHELTDPGEIPLSIELIPPQPIQRLELRDTVDRLVVDWNDGLPWRVALPAGDFIGRATYGDDRWTLGDQEVRPLPPEEDLRWEATWQDD